MCETWMKAAVTTASIEDFLEKNRPVGPGKINDLFPQRILSKIKNSVFMSLKRGYEYVVYVKHSIETRELGVLKYR